MEICYAMSRFSERKDSIQQYVLPTYTTRFEKIFLFISRGLKKNIIETELKTNLMPCLLKASTIQSETINCYEEMLLNYET